MRKSRNSILMCVVLFASIILLSTGASAQVAPYLEFDGNYTYEDGALSFNGLLSWAVEYTDGSFGFFGDDDIVGAQISFGPLTNSPSDPLVFSTSTFTVDGFFTANLTNFVVNNSELMWGNLSNIVRIGGSSRYVDELIAVGGGVGNLKLSFTPGDGGGPGIETFTSNSYGAMSGTVAAPEPISALLFVAGGATLAFGRYRRKRS